ncbi:hypothetical protein L0128_03040, partial [candidate division KSB1 bacterium]|nr:hypothetical protein [candidate division KSB1 bacterium]
DSVDKVPLRRLGFALIAIYGYNSKKITTYCVLKTFARVNQTKSTVSLMTKPFGNETLTARMDKTMLSPFL